MNKIAILYICTGKYKVFWDEFYVSFEKYFLPACEKHYFVFTDTDELKYESGNNRIHRFFQETQEWPYATLLRYSFFLRIEDELKDFDYIFFVNANAVALKEITEDMILPRREKSEKMVFAQHLAYCALPNYEWAYDRNPLTHAYIPYGIGKVYVAGGLNGGEAAAFLEMSKTISRWTDSDLKRNAVPIWHDESYVNRYILGRKDYRVLSPSYIFLKDGVKSTV